MRYQTKYQVDYFDLGYGYDREKALNKIFLGESIEPHDSKLFDDLEEARASVAGELAEISTARFEDGECIESVWLEDSQDLKELQASLKESEGT